MQPEVSPTLPDYRGMTVQQPVPHGTDFGQTSYADRIASVQTAIDRSAPENYSAYHRTIGIAGPAALRQLRDLIPPSFIDPTSWSNLSLDDFFRQTAGRRCGSGGSTIPATVVAWRQLSQPGPFGTVWEEKQFALRTMLANPELYTSLKSFAQTLNQAKVHDVFSEKLMYDLSPSAWCSQVLESMRRASNACRAQQDTGLPYLDAIISTMKSATQEGIFDLSRKGIAFSPRGIKPFERGDFWSYVRPFAPFRHDPAQIVATLGAAALTIEIAKPAMDVLMKDQLSAGQQAGAICLTLTAAMSARLTLFGFQDLMFGDPAKKLVNLLRNFAKQDQQLGRFFEAQGRLEELLGWAELAQTSKLPIAFSKRDEQGGEFRLKARKLGSYQFIDEPTYVLNDVAIYSEKIYALTGANRGGKTNVMTNICTNVVSSQAAGIALAEEFSWTPGTRIIFHTPTKDEGESRLDKEGRDLRKAANVALGHKGPVVWVMDEITSSTSEREGADVAAAFIFAQYCLPSRPCMVIGTHNRELVEKLQQAGVVEGWRMVWKDGAPKYKKADGVEYSSHANEVFQQHGADVASLREQVIAAGGSADRFDVFLAAAGLTAPPTDEGKSEINERIV